MPKSSAANSKETAKEPIGRPFKPGQSGNPSGRPKGLATTAREIVGEEGRPLIQFWAKVMVDPDASLSSRLEASKLLAERGWGKAPSYEPMSNDDPLEMGEVDREIERIMDELAERREAKAVRKPARRRVAGES